MQFGSQKGNKWGRKCNTSKSLAWTKLRRLSDKQQSIIHRDLAELEQKPHEVWYRAGQRSAHRQSNVLSTVSRGLLSMLERDPGKWLFKCWQNHKLDCVFSSKPSTCFSSLYHPGSEFHKARTIPHQTLPHLPPPAIPTLWVPGPCSGPMQSVNASSHYAGDEGKHSMGCTDWAPSNGDVMSALGCFCSCCNIFLFTFYFFLKFLVLRVYKNNRDFCLKRSSENNLILSEKGARMGNIF